MGEEVIETEINGITAISNEMDVCLGFETEVPGNRELRKNFRYRPTLRDLKRIKGIFKHLKGFLGILGDFKNFKRIFGILWGFQGF